jgi:serine/threonine-protein kinase
MQRKKVNNMNLERIRCSENFKEIVPLNKGWSKDKKYIITNNDNSKYLLRISDISLYEKKKEQFELLKKVEQLNINASRPIEFGILNDTQIYMV